MTVVIMKPYLGVPEDRSTIESKGAYVKHLLGMLEKYPLHRTMFRREYLIDPEPQMVVDVHDRPPYRCRLLKAGVWSFGGNFFNYSYAWMLYTDEPFIKVVLREAIEKNMQRPDFLAQTPPPSEEIETVIVGERIEDWVAHLLQGDGYMALE